MEDKHAFSGDGVPRRTNTYPRPRPRQINNYDDLFERVHAVIVDEGVHDELVDDLVGDYLMHDLASELTARTVRQVGPQPLAAEMGMAGVPLVSQRITSFHLCQQEFRR